MPKAKPTRAPAKSKPAEPACPARGLLGAVHDALGRGDYAAYCNGTAASSFETEGRATPAEFAAASIVFRELEIAMLHAGPMPDWMRDAVLRMGEIARNVEGQPRALEQLVTMCTRLLDNTPDAAPDAYFSATPAMLATIRPELGDVDHELIAVLVRRELTKRQPGPAVLAAAIWKLAGLGGVKGKPMTAAAVTTAVSRARAARR